MSDDTSCAFCGGGLSSENVLTPASHLWNFLFHTRVRDDGPAQEAKLTFSLNVGATSQGENEAHLAVCEGCGQEFQSLELLCRELEGVKQQIHRLVDRMNLRRQSDLEGIAIHCGKKSRRGVSSSVLEGCASGKEGISKTLQFLDTYCQTMCGLSREQPEQGLERIINIETHPVTTSAEVTSPLVTPIQNNQSVVKQEGQNNVPDITPPPLVAHIIKVENASQDSLFVDELPLEDPLAEPPHIPPPRPSATNRATASAPTLRRKGKSKKTQRFSQNPPRSRCHVCGKNVNHRYLTIHLRMHSGEKRHVCPVCDKQFTYRQDLTRHHRVVHEKDMPFQCQFCEKRFSLKYNFNSHLKSCAARNQS